ncbi:MAG: hypothetical protein WAV31_04150 [Candidatus Moraniibacteriota bacterium]
MKQKNKKNTRASLIIIVGVLAFILAVLVISKRQHLFGDSKNNSIQTQFQSNQEENNQSSIEMENILAKIVSIDISILKVVSVDGQELDLIVPSEGANFFQEVENNEDVQKIEIGLFQLSMDKDVKITYNKQNNEVLEVIVGQE